MDLRLIKENGVSGSSGLAADESMALRVGSEKSRPTLRLYTYDSYSALVGRFQNIQKELNLEYCLQNCVEFNRRPTGGGAIIMGADQLGVALALKGNKTDTYHRARVLMKQFSEGTVKTLSKFGIEASFRGKNDIEVDGRKIAGLGLHKTRTGGLLFHASILVNLDVELMLNVLRTPLKRITDKAVKLVSGRITTVRKLLSNDITVDEFSAELEKGFSKVFGVNLIKGDWSSEEIGESNKLEAEKYLTEKWVYSKSNIKEMNGRAVRKTEGGLLEVSVNLAGNTLKKVQIGGDIYVSENALADLEFSLAWHSAASDKIKETLKRVYKKRENEFSRISFDDLYNGVQDAVKDASNNRTDIETMPYGCFVKTDGSYA